METKKCRNYIRRFYRHFANVKYNFGNRVIRVTETGKITVETASNALNAYFLIDTAVSRAKQAFWESKCKYYGGFVCTWHG